MEFTAQSNPLGAHFVGIGGAGMSGIARVMHERGDFVTGSDLKESRYTNALTGIGVSITIGHSAEGLGNPSVVVVSSAIRDDNPELIAARERGIEIWPRARMLANLAGARATIAVAGTHGKTSTSAMVATMLAGMGEDPTFVVGGEVTDVQVNARAGAGRHYVVEADESDGSLLYLEPTIAIVTNIEAEHLDHYGSLEAVEQTFVEFMTRVPASGRLVVCADDARLVELAKETGAPTLTYGFADEAQVRCDGLVGNKSGHRFRVTFPGGETVEASIPVPGAHMVQNATAVLAVAYAEGLDVGAAAEALATYGGVKRRFDHIGVAAQVTVVDDYAHHPTEIRATLRAARETGHDRVWAIFQPHRYSRTEALATEFGSAFEDADRLVLMDVYSAGESPIPGVSGKTVVDAVLDAQTRARIAYLPHRADVPAYVAHHVRPGDLVLTMGAGDVTTVGPDLLKAIASNKGEDVGWR